MIIGQIRLFGDTSAFGDLVRKYQSPLRRYLYNLTGGNSSLADDISQESFIKAYSSIKDFRGLGSFRGWLFRIAYRQFVDTYRGFRYNETITERDSGSYSSCTATIEILNQTLESLSDTERNLIILHCVEECSHSEITKITGIPLGTVKSTIARAKNKLKTHLSEDGKDF